MTFINLPACQGPVLTACAISEPCHFENCTKLSILTFTHSQQHTLRSVSVTVHSTQYRPPHLNCPLSSLWSPTPHSPSLGTSYKHGATVFPDGPEICSGCTTYVRISLFFLFDGAGRRWNLDIRQRLSALKFWGGQSSSFSSPSSVAYDQELLHLTLTAFLW